MLALIEHCKRLEIFRNLVLIVCYMLEEKWMSVMETAIYYSSRACKLKRNFDTRIAILLTTFSVNSRVRVRAEREYFHQPVCLSRSDWWICAVFICDGFSIASWLAVMSQESILTEMMLWLLSRVSLGWRKQVKKENWKFRLVNYVEWRSLKCYVSTVLTAISSFHKHTSALHEAMWNNQTEMFQMRQ